MEMKGAEAGADLWGETRSECNDIRCFAKGSIGQRLLAAAEDAARLAGCGVLDIETQDINGAACRLYSAHGYALADVVPNAYPDAPRETMLLWSKQLD